MRKLIVATSVALTGMALAVPNAASADVASQPLCQPLVPCVHGMVEQVIDCPPGGCVPSLEWVCERVFGSCS